MVRGTGTAGDWVGIPALRYRRAGAEGGEDAEDDWPAVTRKLLAGGPGSSCAFELRYFELAPGGRTAHERHHHEHAVVVLRGKGEVLLGVELHALRPGDLVRVAPGDPHQFRNRGREAFGFLCIVDAERDRPTPLHEGEADAPSCDLEPPR